MLNLLLLITFVLSSSEGSEFSDGDGEESVSEFEYSEDGEEIEPPLLKRDAPNPSSYHLQTTLNNIHTAKSGSSYTCNPLDILASDALNFQNCDEMMELLCSRKHATKPDGECQVCFEKRAVYGPEGCEKLCCMECWSNYFDSIEYFPNSSKFNTLKAIKCICLLCRDRLEPEDMEPVVHLCASQEFKEKRNKGRLLQFAAHKKYRPCPNGDCDYFMLKSGICHCGTDVCVDCGESLHPGVKCEDIKEFIAGDSELLIAEITKPCPNCKVKIQKNDGCHHMQCNQCQHKFCWYCLKPWDRELGCGSYRCKNMDAEKVDEIKRDEARTETNSKYRAEYDELKKDVDKMNRMLEDAQNMNTKNPFAVLQDLLKLKRILQHSPIRKAKYLINGKEMLLQKEEKLMRELSEFAKKLTEQENEGKVISKEDWEILQAYILKRQVDFYISQAKSSS